MKRIALVLIAFATVGPCFPPPPVMAGCRVACPSAGTGQVAQEQFVALATAIPIGVPVGQYGATTYSYDARPVNVTVNLNTAAVARGVAEKLIHPGTDRVPSGCGSLVAPQPHVPSAQAPLSAVVTHCAKCHAAGANATAFAKFDATNLAALSCEQRLSAARAVLSEKMPKGTKLTAEEAADVLTELIGK
jgi:hypothetical protein